MKSLIFGILTLLIFISFACVGASFTINFNEMNNIFYLFIALVTASALCLLFGITIFALRNKEKNKKFIISVFYTVFAIFAIALSITIFVLKFLELQKDWKKVLPLTYLLLPAGLFGIFSIIPMFTILKSNNGVVKEKVSFKEDRITFKEKKSKNFDGDYSTSTIDEEERFTPTVLLEKQAKIKEESYNPYNSEFTSTPNEQTFNVSDKLAKLKEDISNNKFVENNDEPTEKEIVEPQPEVENQINAEASLNWEQTNEEIAKEEINQIIQEDNWQEPVQVENHSENIEYINNEVVIEDNEPKDPYKQTIVPRRNIKNAEKYQRPIGNVPNSANMINPNRKLAKVDENYQGKVFLGDSDRIWEAMKKQERRFIQREKPKQKPISNSNIVNSLKIEKTIKLDEDIERVFDPINNENNEKDYDNSSPTIDWD